MSNNKFHKAVWLQGELHLKSPMTIGNGVEVHTDNDLLMDSEGKPFIAGSSLAGAIFAQMSGKCGWKEKELRQLFGEHHVYDEKTKKSELEYRQSMVIIHDAYLKEGSKYQIAICDGIEINEYTKTTKNKSKYNHEVLNPGAVFVLRMEVLIREAFSHLDAMQFMSDFIEMAKQGDLRIGAKTNRGQGKMELKNIQVKELDFHTAEDMMEYVKFDWDKMDGEKGADHLPAAGYRSPYTTIQVPLQIQSALLIRSYFLNNFDVDCEQLTVNGKSVIPGSAWGGVLRHKVKELLKELSDSGTAKKLTVQIFGAEKEDVSAKSSRLMAEESTDKAENGIKKEVTRNKIDRFTGGVLDTGLFSERIAVGGQFDLIIRLKDAKDYEIGALLLAVQEIRSGLLAIGGTTSVGRGTFVSDGDILIDGAEIDEAKMQAYWDQLGKKLKEAGEE